MLPANRRGQQRVFVALNKFGVPGPSIHNKDVTVGAEACWVVHRYLIATSKKGLEFLVDWLQQVIKLTFGKQVALLSF